MAPAARVMGRLLLLIGALAAAGWIVGFVWFVRGATRLAGPVPRADGIVVLTGGSNRIDEGLQLLASGVAPRLLVSGVLPGTSATRLAQEAGVPPEVVAGRVTLGQSAISTHGNAQETQEWVQRYGLHTLVVVTAFYHMPRALAELRRALPGRVLYPHPVLPAPLAQGDETRRLALLAQEYTKLLFVRAGLPYPTANLRPGEGLK